MVDMNNLSDEDILNMDPSKLGEVSTSEVGKPDEQLTIDGADQGNEVTGSGETDEDQSQGSEEQTGDTNEEVTQSEQDDQAKGNPDETDPKDPVKADEPAKEVKDEAKQNEKADKADEPVKLNPEEVVAKIFAPFKANGKMMQVETAEEALDLMRMGANYNKKMAGMKPNLKLLKMLQNNDLLDEGKLEFLIDVSKKNPDAISRLVKESGIDPLDLSDEKAEKYQRTNHRVTNEEIELDGVLEDINDSPAAAQVLDVVVNGWSAEDRSFVTKNPELLKVLTDHAEAGFFDLITAEMDRKKALGQLKGLSDLQAYKQIGDELDAKGKFAHLSGGSSAPSQQTKQAPVVVAPKSKDAKQDEQRNKQRKAAGGSPQAAPAKVDVVFDPLNMPEEEFLKLNPKFA